MKYPDHIVDDLCKKVEDDIVEAIMRSVKLVRGDAEAMIKISTSPITGRFVAAIVGTSVMGQVDKKTMIRTMVDLTKIMCEMYDEGAAKVADPEYINEILAKAGIK